MSLEVKHLLLSNINVKSLQDEEKIFSGKTQAICHVFQKCHWCIDQNSKPQRNSEKYWAQSRKTAEVKRIYFTYKI